jgi:hypothetical protein
MLLAPQIRHSIHGAVMLLASLKGLNALALIFAIGAGLVIFMIGLSFAAFVLKTSCRVVGAEVPDTGKAMVVSFLESLCFAMAYGLAVIIIWGLGMWAGAKASTMAAFTGLSVVTFAFVVPAGLYVPMLRVNFQKGLALAVLRYVITISIFLAFGLVIGVATGKFKI